MSSKPWDRGLNLRQVGSKDHGLGQQGYKRGTSKRPTHCGHWWGLIGGPYVVTIGTRSGLGSNQPLHKTGRAIEGQIGLANSLDRQLIWSFEAFTPLSLLINNFLAVTYFDVSFIYPRPISYGTRGGRIKIGFWRLSFLDHFFRWELFLSIWPKCPKLSTSMIGKVRMIPSYYKRV